MTPAVLHVSRGFLCHWLGPLLAQAPASQPPGRSPIDRLGTKGFGPPRIRGLEPVGSQETREAETQEKAGSVCVEREGRQL